MNRSIQYALIFSLVFLVASGLSTFAAPQSQHALHHPQTASKDLAETAAASGGMMGGTHGQEGMMSGGMMGDMQGQGGMMCPMMMQHMKSMHGQEGMMSGDMMGNMQGQGGMMCANMMGSGQSMMNTAEISPTQLLSQAKTLDLTDQQQKELSSIVTSLRKEMIERRSALELAQVELDEVLTQNNAGLDAIEANLKAVSEAQVAAQLTQIEASRNAKAILTTSQIEKLKTSAQK